MTLAASNGTNSDQSMKSIEEQDHLSRSTKKLKAHGGDEDDNMAESSLAIEGPTDFLNNFDTNSGAPNLSKPQALKSFKEALTNRSYNEQAFDDDLNRLSTDEDESETEAMEEELCDDEPDLGIPQIKLPKNLLSKIRRPWKDCFIVKPLGKSIGYKLLTLKVRKIWDLQGDFEAIDLGLGFFLFKFQMNDDYTKVLSGGPWIILDHYLTVRKWCHDFKPSHVREVTTAIWVRFPQLPIEYYIEKVLYHIAKSISKPLKIDINTATSTRGKFDKVCIEVNLSQPLTTYFAIGKYTYGIEYEHLHFFCFNCGHVGHRRDRCSAAPVNPSGDIVPEKESVQNLTVGNEKESRPSCSESGKAHSNDPRSDQPSEGFGPWMLVSRRSLKHSYANKKEARSRSREKAHGKGPSKQT
ncbi:uncharacterized protein LOC114310107 [Camellia sinensis]|uniref:uncharacterized protein LOC114310107 n=1 Tax=Camellia sinensis TaxID=4442 RepID=UPI001035BA56|nr:uncharacterized protein LOC114310107 [Camellia sinensis]